MSAVVRSWRALAALTLALPLAADAAGAQGVVRVRDTGPGRSGRVLRGVLAAPHVTLLGDTGTAVALRRDTLYASTVLVLGGDVTVASTVRGDVVVVGGDLFLHPGAQIDGRVIAVGGCVYNSTLAIVRRERVCFRDETFDVVREGGGAIALDYRQLDRHPLPAFTLPAPLGLRLPSYDRVDGVVVPFGPRATLAERRVVLEPLVTYRSHLGAVDPSLGAAVEFGRRTRVEASAGRGTFTNDAWSRADVVNGGVTLFTGQDARNYFRADRAEATLHRRFETETQEIEPFVGARTEFAWSTGPQPDSPRHAWSLLGRDDEVEGMRRPNPRIERGHLTSALAGTRVRWRAGGLTMDGSVGVEAPLDAPGDRRFVQTTVDGDLAFPTFGTQSFRLLAHAVLTAGDTAPPQRFAYVGGGPTLPTMLLLEEGGDQMLYLEGRYAVPLERVRLPLVGVPTVTLRYILGGAAPGGLPPLTQNVGLRLGISLLRLDFTIDPASRRTRAGAAVTLSR